MIFTKKLFRVVFISALLFQAGVAWGARVLISGTGSRNAIDTLTFSGSALSRSTTAAVASEMIIFNTSNGESPGVVRNRIVNLGSGLSNFTVDSVPGNPDEFEVDNIPPGGALLIQLDGDEVNSSSEGSASSKADQYFRLSASQIPTLSEWGLIIFGTLLLVSLVWFIRRRRKPVRVSKT